MQSVTCPSEPMLTDFSLGKLDAAQAEEICQHLETCAECRQRVAGVSGDSFVERLKQAGSPPSVRRERTYVPGESLANAANSTDGSSAREDGLPRPSRTVDDEGKHDGPGRPPHVVAAPPELANHPDYELIKELGQGGMGTVYLAKNRMMDRLEVLKVISKELLERPGALERFQQEIRAAARLAHPNIVAAYQVLRLGNSLVFAMEHVPGRDLGQVVKGRGYLPVVNAALYIQQVASGLQHAFEKGMVHRDIKPNNLMLTVKEKKHVVKILDFGLARATSEKDALSGLTKSGQMLGTPDFIAPEQILDARKADIRADIYSLGCTLYFLLSGSPPFQTTSLYEVLEAHHKREAKPLNLVRPDVPMGLAAVVAKMMAKDPAKRYQTPSEVAKALVPFSKPRRGVTVPLTDATRSPSTGDTAHGQAAATPISRVTPLPSSLQVPLAVPPTAVAVPSPLPTGEADRQFGVSIATDRPTPRRHRWWWSLPPRRKATAVMAAGAAAAFLLGLVFLLQPKDGAIRVEINDEQIEVAIKGTDIVLKQADNGKDIKVSAGEKTLIVERGDFKFETDKLVLKKGETVTVAVTLLTGLVEVKQGDKALGRGKLPAVWHGWPADAPPPAIAPFDAATAKKHQQAWAKYLGVPDEQTNSIGMKLVLIPPGEFAMGSTPEQIAAAKSLAVQARQTPDAWTLNQLQSEMPSHRVSISRPYLLAMTETTLSQYRRFIEATNYVTETERFGGGYSSSKKETDAHKNKRSWRSPGYPVQDDSAVSQITWNDAVAFCNWLSEGEQKTPCYQRDDKGEWALSPDGGGYRLPTEAEWEYACRAGTISQYSFGDSPAELKQFGGAVSTKHTVATKKPNPFDLYDMHGNVEEWCHDWFRFDYYKSSPAADPWGRSISGARVMRGGIWDEQRQAVLWGRSTFRRAYAPLTRMPDLGFRVVRHLTDASFPRGHSAASN